MTQHLKIVGGFGLLAIIMTAYVAFMGTSANRASAVAIHDFSQNALNQGPSVRARMIKDEIARRQAQN